MKCNFKGLSGTTEHTRKESNSFKAALKKLMTATIILMSLKSPAIAVKNNKNLNEENYIMINPWFSVHTSSKH